MPLPLLTRVVGSVLVVSGSCAPAWAATADEDMVKAAFLSKFARYVTWPPQARAVGGAPLVICTIGADPMGQLVQQVAGGQRIDDHPIVVRRTTAGAAASSCHVAFVQGSSPNATAAALTALAPYPVLTVTDQRAGAVRGMIHFTVAGNRVRFFINSGAATQRGLEVSSRLLSLAVEVTQ